MCVCTCVCVCAHAGFTLFDYVIDLKHGVLSTFFLMIGLKNIDVINLSHFPAIPFISMPSFRSSFSLSYWKFQVKLSYLKGEFITFDSHTHTHIHTLSFYLSLPLSLLNFYDFHCKEIRSFGKNPNYNLVQFSSVQSLSCVRLFATP